MHVLDREMLGTLPQGMAKLATLEVRERFPPKAKAKSKPKRGATEAPSKDIEEPTGAKEHASKTPKVPASKSRPMISPALGASPAEAAAAMAATPAGPQVKRQRMILDALGDLSADLPASDAAKDSEVRSLMSSRPHRFNLMHAPPRSGAEFPDGEARTELTLLMARLIASSTARAKQHVVLVRELLEGQSQSRLRKFASAQGVSSRSGAPGSGQMRTAKELREAAAAKLQLVGQRILSESLFSTLSETSGLSEQAATVATNSDRTVESKIATPSTTTKDIAHTRRALKLTLSDDLQQLDLQQLNVQLCRQQKRSIMATHHKVKRFSTAFALKQYTADVHPPWVRRNALASLHGLFSRSP